MFSGIIEASAHVISTEENQLTIERPASFSDISIGSSIAVSGVCLSVVAFDEKRMQFDVVSETWDRSALGELSLGDRVNLERSLSVGGRLDGHIVQGHVEGTGNVKSIMKNGKLVINLPKSLIKFCVQKGSIAIDGVSLTIADVGQETVTVALVPHTLEHTTLGAKEIGDMLNIETDIFGRYVYAFTHEEAAHQE